MTVQPTRWGSICDPVEHRARSGSANALIAAWVLLCCTAFRCPGPSPRTTPNEGGGGDDLTGGGGIAQTGGTGGDPTTGGGGMAGGGMAGAGGCDQTQIDTDPDNCGACGRPCEGTGVDTPLCSEGLCKSTCLGGSVNLSCPVAPTADDGCEMPGRRAFVTSTAILANFGGAILGDDVCQMLADASGVGGTWASWTSDSSTSPSERFIQSTVPYLLMDGTLVANDWADLADGSLQHGIDQDEFGVTIPPTEVWTGTQPSGLPLFADGFCDDWTSTTNTLNGTVGIAGVNATDTTWTEVYLQECSRDNVRLFCIEQ